VVERRVVKGIEPRSQSVMVFTGPFVYDQQHRTVIRAMGMSLEGRISDEVVRELKRRGQPVQMVTDWNDNMGHANVIRVDHEQGFLEGAADPRGDGAALGY